MQSILTSVIIFLVLFLQNVLSFDFENSRFNQRQPKSSFSNERQFPTARPDVDRNRYYAPEYPKYNQNSKVKVNQAKPPGTNAWVFDDTYNRFNRNRTVRPPAWNPTEPVIGEGIGERFASEDITLPDLAHLPEPSCPDNASFCANVTNYP